jgi:hypothetical protein
MSKQKSTSDILKKRAKRKKKGFFRKFILWTFLLGFFLILCGALAGVATFYYFEPGPTQDYIANRLHTFDYYHGVFRRRAENCRIFQGTADRDTAC